MMTALSPKRAEVAEQVRAGLVRYDVPTWTIDGTVATGWDGRTLREMRREGQIVVGADGSVSLAPEVAAGLTDPGTA
jgi:hypothetical protein